MTAFARTPSRFAHAIREELWSHGRLLESRLSYGEAVEDGGGIVAADTRDDALVTAAEGELDRLRAAVPRHVTVRLVAEAGPEGTTGTITVRQGALSIVTTAEAIGSDLELLRIVSRNRAIAVSDLRVPMLWKNGSAAVLLHETVGHPLEHGLEPLPLPPWLAVDIPIASRRATFRDIPQLRMKHVSVSQTNAPFALPPQFIEVELVEGGAYDPLTDVVTMHVAVPRFVIVAPRTSIAILGARGEPLRYPGVICSREGQELVVGSVAPEILTVIR